MANQSFVSCGPAWFDIVKYDAAQDLDIEGWLYQTSVRQFVEAVGVTEHDSYFTPHLNERDEVTMLKETANSYWQQIIEDPVLPLPASTDAFDRDPFLRLDHDDRGHEYAPVRSLDAYDLYVLLEQWCWKTNRDVEDAEGRRALYLKQSAPVSGNDLCNDEYDVSGADEINDASVGLDLAASEHPEQSAPGSGNKLGDDEYDLSGADEISNAFVGLDLGASDEVLVKHFKAFLKKVRPSVSGSGPAKDLLSDRRLYYWHRFRVLAYWDLYIWSEAHNVKLTHAQHAELLFGAGFNDYDGETVRQKVRTNHKRLLSVYRSLRSKKR